MEGKRETFAGYLAKQYVAKKGFKPVTVPEAGRDRARGTALRPALPRAFQLSLGSASGFTAS